MHEREPIVGQLHPGIFWHRPDRMEILEFAVRKRLYKRIPGELLKSYGGMSLVNFFHKIFCLPVIVLNY